ncbi:CopG family antitoxin [Rickettsiella endosymbiont of Miltochrista miniata]|uniref:CopG family antitoxin n=1 Tax=Rickettsiella endosymbiont of Miltochrista miniata TaxID=3066239 RepID=UPI00313E697D
MKKTKSNRFDSKLDKEEQAMSDAIDKALDRGKLKSIKNLKKEMNLAREAAANFQRKDARVTLRLSSGDLERLKQKAAYKGLPYQTFIASVLHEYAAGHFIEAA